MSNTLPILDSSIKSICLLIEYRNDKNNEIFVHSDMPYLLNGKNTQGRYKININDILEIGETSLTISQCDYTTQAKNFSEMIDYSPFEESSGDGEALIKYIRKRIALQIKYNGK